MLAFVFLIVLPALALADVGSAMFEAIDNNKDKEITQAELEGAIMSLDTDKDNAVNKQELKEFEKSVIGFSGHHEATFKVLDRDSNGHVDKSDMDNIFNDLDANNDHHLNTDEFQPFVTLITTDTHGPIM